MDDQTSLENKNKQALIIGLISFFTLCCILFAYTATSRSFQQITRSLFVHATQTVVPVTSNTSQPIASSPEDIVSTPFIERFNMADPYISEALNHYSQGDHANAILAWDKALEIVPDYAEGYYLRGQSYLALLQNEGSLNKFMQYLSHAGENFDKAIELKPYYKGDYYLGRYKYYDHLSGVQVNRIDRIRLEQIAFDNLLLANQLGNYDPLAERYVIFSNIVVGNCDDGIDQANHLISTATEPVGNYYTGLALGYACKNDAQTALQYINKAIELKDTCLNRFERAKILYEIGRNEEAMADLNYSLSKDPYFCGERYYLRGLLYAETGDLQKAQEDLDSGMAQTWGRGGLLPYTQGKIALAQGKSQSAVQYFQEAELTYPLLDPLLVKIQKDLDTLGASSLETTPLFPSATAIPTPTPR